ncbi:hypothetical protein D3C78_20050 [compost metagenome]
MKVSEREMNQWAKSQMKLGYRLKLVQDKSAGYQKGFLDQTTKEVIITNVTNRQRQVLIEMQDKVIAKQ